MDIKDNAPAGEEPVEVFRQFAWHLAGTLASVRGRSAGTGRADAGTRPAGRAAQRPAKVAGKRG